MAPSSSDAVLSVALIVSVAVIYDYFKVVSPQSIVNRMQVGCNLGQFFETVDHDTSAATVFPVLKAFADKGFRSVRIPVTWYPAQLNGACQLDNPAFMAQLDAAVHYASHVGLAVMLNAHSENWMYTGYDGSAVLNAKWSALWQRIAQHYKHLRQCNTVFELMNEPQGVLGQSSNGTASSASALQLCRQMNSVACAAIRSVDSTRIIALCVNDYQSMSQCAAVFPTLASFPGGGADRYLMMSVHYYTPWTFCGNTGSNAVYLNQANPTVAMTTAVERAMTALITWKSRVDYPRLALAVTEYGVGDSTASGRRNTDIVRYFYHSTTAACRSRGILPMVWNDSSQQSWFGLSTLAAETGGTVQWLYGLADSVVGQ
jgi:endoglucanase